MDQFYFNLRMDYLPHMDIEIIKSSFSDPFFVKLLAFNISCLVVGILLGRIFFTSGKSNKAFEEGLKKAKEDHEKEKQQFSNDVSTQLLELRNGILKSAQAYQQAVEVIGTHLGTTDTLKFNNVLIENKVQEIEVISEEQIQSENYGDEPKSDKVVGQN